MNIPETRYARSQDGAFIAYQVFGQGDVDLLWISPGSRTWNCCGSIRPSRGSTGRWRPSRA
jgi:hypothetical protein